MRCDKARHYRAHQDIESLCVALYTQVKPGDSLSRVQALLGDGTAATNREKFVRVMNAVTNKNPQAYSDGIEDQDQFIGFTGRGQPEMTVFLQFRNGRLINFQPSDFEKVPRVIP